MLGSVSVSSVSVVYDANLQCVCLSGLLSFTFPLLIPLLLNYHLSRVKQLSVLTACSEAGPKDGPRFHPPTEAASSSTQLSPQPGSEKGRIKDSICSSIVQNRILCTISPSPISNEGQPPPPTPHARTHTPALIFQPGSAGSRWRNTTPHQYRRRAGRTSIMEPRRRSPRFPPQSGNRRETSQQQHRREWVVGLIPVARYPSQLRVQLTCTVGWLETLTGPPGVCV